jgi:acetyl-CoA carboxylase carboxyl transferase subunit alpha
MASRLKSYLSKTLNDLEGIDSDQLVESRYEKFRRIGVFLDNAADPAE